MKKQLKIFLSLAFLMVSISFFAQPAGGPPPGPSGGQPPCWPPPCIPVDGGISLFIAIGAAFGGKKVYDHYKNKQ